MNRTIIRVVLFFYLVVSISLVEAQFIVPDGNEADPAILVRGPAKSMGFPLIYPNAIETWTGYYRYKELEVVVSFTRKDILVPAEWESAFCAEIDGFSPDNFSFYYKNNDWSLLFQFKNSVRMPLVGAPSLDLPAVDPIAVDVSCPFINKFITRLKYFLRDADPKGPPLLPAIIEF